MADFAFSSPLLFGVWWSMAHQQPFSKVDSILIVWQDDFTSIFLHFLVKRADTVTINLYICRSILLFISLILNVKSKWQVSKMMPKTLVETITRMGFPLDLASSYYEQPFDSSQLIIAFSIGTRWVNQTAAMLLFVRYLSILYHLMSSSHKKRNEIRWSQCDV